MGTLPFISRIPPTPLESRARAVIPPLAGTVRRARIDSSVFDPTRDP
jgi:hypothetical protein